MSSKIRNLQPMSDCWNSIGVWSFTSEKCKKLTEYIHCRNCPVFSEMGHLVFEKPYPSGYLSQWRKEIAENNDTNESTLNSVLVFRIGVEWFAFPTTIMNEVANERSIHKIPRNMNSYISGIVNINGEVNVCYSLGEILGLHSDSTMDIEDMGRNTRRLIVIEIEAVNYVFLVDYVKGILWYGNSDICPVPATLNIENSSLLHGSINKYDHQIAIFNIENLTEKLLGLV